MVVTMLPVTDELQTTRTPISNAHPLLVRLEVTLIHPLAQIPFRKRSTDAGYDIFSVEAVQLIPGHQTMVHTGICIAAPPGFYYTIEGRSSLWTKGIMPHRGIIDATYCGELEVSLVNYGYEPYPVTVGQRIAQLILHRQYEAEFVPVKVFSPEYNQRGLDGFGSTGR